jgi:6-pyruvoyl-tetrahydropterin synthase
MTDPTSLTFTAQVTRQIEAAHHNGPIESKCHGNHGHSWTITIRFGYTPADLDQYGWGIDFLRVKKLIDRYDHKDLNTILAVPSAENLAIQLWSDFEQDCGRSPLSVTVEEGKGNIVTLE